MALTFSDAHRIYRDIGVYLIKFPNGSRADFINREVAKGYDQTLVSTIIDRFIAVVRSRFLNINSYADLAALFLGKTQAEADDFFRTFSESVFADTTLRALLVQLRTTELNNQIITNNDLISSARIISGQLKNQYPNNLNVDNTILVITQGIETIQRINNRLTNEINNL